jgi:hypothetical protein
MHQVIDRTILGFLLLTLALYSCKAEDIPEELREPYPQGEQVYLVPDSLIATEFISPIDTFSNLANLPLTAFVYSEVESNVAGHFIIDDIIYETQGFFGIIINGATYQRRIFKKHAVPLSIGSQVQFVALVNRETVKSKVGTITQKQEQCDLLGVKWGMDIEEAWKRELIKNYGSQVIRTFPSLISEDSPHWAPEGTAGKTDLHFQSRKLVRVTEYIQITSANRASVLNHLNIRAKKLGLNDAVVMLQDFTLRQPYEWSKGSLNFKIYTENKSGQNYVGIEYTPRQ